MPGVEVITQLLLKWSDGVTTARDELMPWVYSELKRLARGYFRRERQSHPCNQQLWFTTRVNHRAGRRLIAISILLTRR